MNLEKFTSLLQEKYGDDCTKMFDDIDKERIVLRLLPKEENVEPAHHSIRTTYMGIKVELRYLVYQTEEDYVTSAFTIDMLDKADVREEELFDLALKNTLRYNQPEIHRMGEFVKILMEQTDSDVSYDIPDFPDVYVIVGKHVGAPVVLFDNETLKKLAEMIDDDILMIPESEYCMIVTGKNSSDGNLCIKAVIGTQLNVMERETRLSEYVYVYEKDSGNIRYGCIDQYV